MITFHPFFLLFSLDFITHSAWVDAKMTSHIRCRLSRYFLLFQGWENVREIANSSVELTVFFLPSFPTVSSESQPRKRKKFLPPRFVLPSFFYGLLITPNQTSFPSFMWQQCCLLLSCGVIPIICSSVVPFATRTYHNRTQYERHKAGKRRRCSTVVEEVTHKGNTKCLFFSLLVINSAVAFYIFGIEDVFAHHKDKTKKSSESIFSLPFSSLVRWYIYRLQMISFAFFSSATSGCCCFFFSFFFSFQCYHWWLLNMPITSPLSSAPSKCVFA